MIAKILCRLDLPKNLKTQNISSVLHGVLMELLDTNLVEQLHTLRYNPLRQRIYFEKEDVIWEVVSLYGILTDELINIFKNIDEINIKHHNQIVQLKSKEIKEIDPEKFVRDIMNSDEELSHFVKLDVVSPMSFKSDGNYDIFPDVRKILRSVMMNFDYFSEKTKIYDYDTLEYLIQQVRVVDYNLHSTRFYLEKVKIPSFKGNITLKIQGNSQILKLVYLILNYAEISGIGIKTSLGMGCVRIRR
jgi:CRISPR-associated endoribonuclease Cas6